MERGYFDPKLYQSLNRKDASIHHRKKEQEIDAKDLAKALISNVWKDVQRCILSLIERIGSLKFKRSTVLC